MVSKKEWKYDSNMTNISSRVIKVNINSAKSLYVFLMICNFDDVYLWQEVINVIFLLQTITQV